MNKRKYYELKLYSSDVSKQDIKYIIENIIKPEVPLIEFLDLSWYGINN